MADDHPERGEIFDNEERELFWERRLPRRAVLAGAVVGGATVLGVGAWRLGERWQGTEAEIPGIDYEVETVFASMPESEDTAEAMAAELAPTLIDNTQKGVRSLVMFEPGGIDLRAIQASTYEKYFRALRAAGVADDAIGSWVPFPEPNIPEWGPDGTTDPTLFRQDFTTVAQALKQEYQDARVGLLLNSKSYPSGSWEDGSFSAEGLLEYVKGLPKGLVDEFHYQGFHYGYENTRPQVYLPEDPVVAVVQELGVAEVYLATGTFSRMVVPYNEAEADDAERQRILNELFEQARRIQRRLPKCILTVNMFAEDKITPYPEGEQEADWSYRSGQIEMLERFRRQLIREKIGFAIYRG